MYWLIPILVVNFMVFFSSALAEDDRSIGFVAFGDSGYHLDHPDPRTGEMSVAPTTEALREWFKAEWIEDQKPLSDLVYPPTAYHEDEGGYAVDSGLHAEASAMHATCESALCNFGLMLGDNIYPVGAVADERDDALFQDILVKPYVGLADGRENFQIYAVLGNHDWKVSHAGAMAQIDFLEDHPLFHMDGTVYRAVPDGAEGLVELFAIDTEILLANASVREDKLDAQGKPIEHDELKDYPEWIVPKTIRERTMVKWLEDALKESKARWKIVIGHNPLWSSGGGKYEQARELRRLILPTLCRYADLYLAGHDHTLEVHEDTCQTIDENLKPLPTIVSGAASKLRGLNSAFMVHQERNNPHLVTRYAEGMVWGFAHVTVNDDAATVRMFKTPLDGSGMPELAYRHVFERRTQTESQVVER